MNEILASDILNTLGDIRKELKESNRLKILEIKLKYNIPEFDLPDWDLVDQTSSYDQLKEE